MNKEQLIKFKTGESKLELLNKGGVYFIKNNSNNLIKIGKSKNIYQRMTQLYSTFRHIGEEKVDVDLIGYILCENYDKLEIDLHKKFKKNKIVNEWFDINEDKVSNVIKLINANEYNNSKEKELTIESLYNEIDKIKHNKETWNLHLCSSIVKRCNEEECICDLEKWDENEEDTKYIYNMLLENIKYLEEIGEIDNYNDYKEYKIEADNKNYKALQEYMMDLNGCDYQYFAIKDLISEKELELTKRVCGITEVIYNPWFDLWCRNAVQELKEKFSEFKNIIEQYKDELLYCYLPYGDK